MITELDVDVIVAGSGVGGLMAAYHAQRANSRVLLLGGSGGASRRISSMNTALGHDTSDTPEGLLDDMIRAGGGINSMEVAAAIARRVPAETNLLVELGVPFAHQGSKMARRQAAGSSGPRAVFSHGMIGVDIARTLLHRMRASRSHPLTEVKGGVALDMRVGEGGGIELLAYSPREQRWLRISAGALVLATGGAGQLFGTTTNPRGSRGAGYAMGLISGAELVDMEFISFEPFVTATPGMPLQDLPTTVLREGAKLRNALGEEFLDTESAPSKDVICRAMVHEVAEGRGTESGAVLFDLRDMEPDIANGYVQIVEALKKRGLESCDAQLEVMPAQHFLMGGLKIDPSAETSLPGVFAVGEVAGGVHGAHRLAAGGGLEVVGGGAIAGENAAEYALARSLRGPKGKWEPRPDLLGSSMSDAESAEFVRIQKALDAGCGIIRQGGELADAVTQIEEVVEKSESDDNYVYRSGLVALTIARTALERRESRGDHYRADFPTQDDAQWHGNLTVRLEDKALAVRFIETDNNELLDSTSAGGVV